LWEGKLEFRGYYYMVDSYERELYSVGCMVKEEMLVPLLRMVLWRTERLVYLGCMVKEEMLVPLLRMALWKSPRD
jgi:hypothetical protein